MGPTVDVAPVSGNSESEQASGDLGWPHLCSHKASTTGRVQDQGSMVWTLKGLREAVNCKAGSTVLQGSHILGTGC